MIRFFFLWSSVLLLCTGCYRLPDEGEVSVVPNTNNPSVSRQKRGGMPFPGME